MLVSVARGPVCVEELTSKPVGILILISKTNGLQKRHYGLLVRIRWWLCYLIITILINPLLDFLHEHDLLAI